MQSDAIILPLPMRERRMVNMRALLHTVALAECVDSSGCNLFVHSTQAIQTTEPLGATTLQLV